MGLVPLFVMTLIYLAPIRTGRIPEALVIASIGTALAWMDGVATPGAVSDASASAGWKGIMSTWVEVFSNIQHLGRTWCYPAGGVHVSRRHAHVLEHSQDNGAFNLRETMLVDAAGTMIAALFSCAGTTVYLGPLLTRRSTLLGLLADQRVHLLRPRDHRPVCRH